jgi:hypothetical protein
MVKKRNAYRILVGTPEQKERDHSENLRRKWMDNIKLDLREDGMVWIGLIWLKIGTIGWLL